MDFAPPIPGLSGRRCQEEAYAVPMNTPAGEAGLYPRRLYLSASVPALPQRSFGTRERGQENTSGPERFRAGVVFEIHLYKA
jgi:hypothetical protein